MKPLHLSYELAWRTASDQQFMQSTAWKSIRQSILKRDNYTCQYCGFRSEKGMQVNHIDGNPKNNNEKNLEVICSQCHMILHSGLWCAVKGVIKLYADSNFPQNEIISLTREMRQTGKTDEEIIAKLGLSNQVPWIQDLSYLSKLYGFISSNTPRESSKPYLTETEQRRNIADRTKW